MKGRIKNVAIIAEVLCNFGGTEKSILALVKELNKKNIRFDIYAGIYSPEKTFPEFKSFKIRRILKKKLPAIVNTFYLRRKFRNLRLKDYDGYILYGFHTIAAAKNNHPNVWWATNPLNYLYGFEGKGPDKSIEYMYGKNKVKCFLIHAYLKLLKFIDQKQVRFVDKIFAVGLMAQRRMGKAYPRRKIGLIFAPVNLSKFKNLGRGGYYISVARLSDEKNVDKIVRAFQDMPDKKLYIVGSGPSEKKIAEMAKGFKNIKLFGFVKEEELPKLVGKSIAMIGACENEDYSLNLIESIAAGKPTISVNTDRSRKEMEITSTGLLIESASPELIKEAVGYLDIKKAEKMKRACIERSKLFSLDNYVNGLLGALE